MNGAMLPVASLGGSMAESPRRIASIDALRGLVMFTMIFVNDIHGASREIVPWWMRHFKEDGNGMTFVDLVFPAFLFIVGMSIPFAIGSRRARGEPLGKLVLHVAGRTVALLFLGILIVNDESPAPAETGWSPELWAVLMYASAILAFCDLAPQQSSPQTQRRANLFRISTWVLRAAGLALLIYLTFNFRGENDQRILTLSPFSIRTQWYGILGLIGWAYLVAAAAFLIFRTNRTAFSVVARCLCVSIPLRDRSSSSTFTFVPRFGSAGLSVWARHSARKRRFPSLASCSARSWSRRRLLQSAAGRNSRCSSFWASPWRRFYCTASTGSTRTPRLPRGVSGRARITAALWLLLYFVCDVWRIGAIAKPLALAGQNVLLAYLLSNLLDPLLGLLKLDDWYDGLAGPHLANAFARSAGTALIILSATVLINRLGFRLKI